MTRLFACLLLAGCSATEIDVTLQIDPAIALDQVHTIGFEVDGDGDPYHYGFTGALQDRTQRLVYRAGRSSGTVTLVVRLYRLDGVAIGCGRTDGVALSGGKAVMATVDILPGDCPDALGDMAMPDDLSATADLGAPDLVTLGPPCLFCDNFESGNTSKWMQLNTPAAVETISTMRHSGSYAVNFMLAHNDGSLPTAQLFHVMNDRDLWIRAWYLGSASEFNAEGAASYLRVYDASDSGVWMGETNYGNQFDQETTAGASSPASTGWIATAGSWTCVEWHVDTNNGRSEIYVADSVQPISMLSFTPFVPEYVKLGLEGYFGTSLIVDDVYIAASRVGCSTPTP
jgi:hypothetical protein